MKPIYWNLKMESPVGLKYKITNCIITKDFFVDHAKKKFSGMLNNRNALVMPSFFISKQNVLF